MSKRNQPQHDEVLIEEVTSDDERGFAIHDPYGAGPSTVETDHSVFHTSQAETEAPAGPASALTAYQAPKPSSVRQALAEAVLQQHNDKDDSKIAFADATGRASTFGMPNTAPPPYHADTQQASAPPAEVDSAEYTAWMQATELGQRQRFPEHERWQQNLKQDVTGQRPELALVDLPEDDISAQFKQSVRQFYAGQLQHDDMMAFTGQRPLPDSLRDPEVYASEYSQAQAGAPPIVHDDLQVMIDKSNHHFKAGYGTNLTGFEVPANQFQIISDHGGTATGHKYIILGPGPKKNIGVVGVKGEASDQNETMRLARVRESERFYNLTVDYIHIPSRFTIIRIYQNEMGFVYNRSTGAIQKLNEGRYFIKERDACFAYIGKTKKPNTSQQLSVMPHSLCQDPFVRSLAARLSLLMVTPGHVAFVRDRMATYTLNARQEPYLLDANHGLCLINFANQTDNVQKADDFSLMRIRLQRGEYVIFKHLYQNNSNEIVWAYDAQDPRMNQVDLVAAHNFSTNVDIHLVTEQRVDAETLSVLSLKPSHFALLQTPDRQMRFVEEARLEPVVIRHPWQILAVAPKAQSTYEYGSASEGNQVARLMLSSSEWAAVKKQNGRLELYPPLLDGSPYYFMAPTMQFLQTVNRNHEGETHIEVPGIGRVSIVNVQTGSIGVVCIENVYQLINPSPVPYVFLPPDRFIEIVPQDQANYSRGGLHRLNLQPDEQAVISKDGRQIELPGQEGQLGDEHQSQNGVFVFYSNQMRIFGPLKRNDKVRELGTYTYFNVSVSELAHGGYEGEFKTWGPGQHKIDSAKNQTLEGFFKLTVDPVVLNDVHVVFNNGVSAKVNVYVTYDITDPKQAILRFKTNDALHDYVEKTTRSEIIKMFRSEPPIGYKSINDNGATQQRAADASSPAEEVGSKAMHRFEAECASHVRTEFNNNGISLNYLHVTDWEVDRAFQEQARQGAMELQAAQTATAQAEIALAREKIEQQKALQAEDAKIALQQRDNEVQKLQRQQEADRSVVDAKCKADVLAAEQEAKLRVTAAKAKADADAKVATSEADFKILQSEAESKKQVALSAKAEQEVLNAAATAQAKAAAEQLKIKAESEAEAKVAASTAEKIALARADQEAAQAKLQAAQTEAEAILVKAQANQKLAESEAALVLAKGEAQAKVASKMMQAKFTGLEPEQIAQLMQMELLMEVTKAQLAATPQVVTHTMDPNVAQELSQRNMQHMMTCMQAASGMGPQVALMQNMLPGFGQTTSMLQQGSVLSERQSTGLGSASLFATHHQNQAQQQTLTPSTQA